MSATQIILPTDTVKPEAFKFKISKQNDAVFTPQYREGRNPIIFNHMLYNIMSKRERTNTTATLAGQYSDDAVIDNNEERDDTLNNVDYAEVPDNYMDKYRSADQNTILAKLHTPVSFSKEAQLKDQVRININDVNVTSLDQLSFTAQKNVHSKVELSPDVLLKDTDTDAITFVRRNYALPTKSNKNLIQRIAQGQLGRNTRLNQSATDIVRKSQATYSHTKNFLNSSFAPGKVTTNLAPGDE